VDHKAYEGEGSYTYSIRVKRILHLLYMSEKDLTPTRVREILHQSLVGVRSLPFLKSEVISLLFSRWVFMYITCPSNIVEY
jgi:hypothetical protein